MHDPALLDSPQASASKGRGTLFLLGLLGLGVLFSGYLAFNRIYQIDEAQNAYMAWLMGTGRAHQAFVSAPAFLFPFAGLARWSVSPTSLFLVLRAGFWLLFWVNLILLVRGAGFKIRSQPGLLALLMVGLLPPLWIYGLEVRHENLVVLGILLLWNLGRRPGRMARWAFLLMGVVAVLMQASAFKSLAYWGPILGIMLFLAPREVRARALRDGLLGALLALVLVAGLHKAFGTWSSFVAEQTGFLRSAGAVQRFAPISVLSRLFFQTPLLMGLVLIPAGLRVGFFFKTKWNLSGAVPECLVFVWTLVLLGINPNPFPYNVLPILATGCLAAGALLREIENTKPVQRNVVAMLAGVVLITQGVPFLIQADKLLEMDNSRQTLLMTQAVELTDPMMDAVYDGAGLVPTRRSLGYYWFVNIMNVEKYRGGSMPGFRSLATQDAPPVVLPTYRISYLEPADLQFLRDNYVSLAEDFMVLGDVSKASDRVWACLHAGRYEMALPPSAPKDAWILVDGLPTAPGVHVFARGIHRIQSSPDAAPSILWVGPHLMSPPDLQGGKILRGVFPIPNAF